MKTVCAGVSLLVLTLTAGLAAAAEGTAETVPLERFVEVFTDPRATSAQKELSLPAGTWYRGVITVSDVDYYRQQGKDPARAEIRDYNYPGGCYLLMFRTLDTEGALRLKVGDRALVRGRLKDFGIHLPRFVSGCETRFALFTDCEVLEIMPQPGAAAGGAPAPR